MLTVYSRRGGCVVAERPVPGEPLPDGIVWADLLEPTREDILQIKQIAGIDVPTPEEMREKFAAKFGVDLRGHPLQITIRKYSEAQDGNVHNDSKMKIVTILIYFNEEWKHAGGRLRLVRTPDNINDYAAEVPPEGGTLLAFRRNEHSYHGFMPCVGERRSLQMYWVSPKRAARGEKKLTLKRRLKRWLKLRPR